MYIAAVRHFYSTSAIYTQFIYFSFYFKKLTLMVHFCTLYSEIYFIFGPELFIYQLCGLQTGIKNLRIILEIWENYVGASVNSSQVIICNIKRITAKWSPAHLCGTISQRMRSAIGPKVPLELRTFQSFFIKNYKVPIALPDPVAQLIQ